MNGFSHSELTPRLKLNPVPGAPGFPRYPYPNDDTFPGRSGRVEKNSHPRNILVFCSSKITLWWTYKKQWKITMLLMGKSTISMPFSIAMLVHQRVSQIPMGLWRSLNTIPRYPRYPRVFGKKMWRHTGRFITFHNLSAVSSYLR